MELEELKKIIKEYVEEHDVKEIDVLIEDLYDGKKMVEVRER